VIAPCRTQPAQRRKPSAVADAKPRTKPIHANPDEASSKERERRSDGDAANGDEHEEKDSDTRLDTRTLTAGIVMRP